MAEIPTEKRCTACGATKFTCEFYKDSSRPDGRFPQCKACRANEGRQRYLRHRDKSLALNKAWRKRNPEKVKAYAIRHAPYYAEYQKKRRQRDEGKFDQYRRGAATRGHEFNLTLDEFISFKNKPCWYCGRLIVGFGIDRVDNAQGYTMKNSVACCLMCNVAKRAHSLADFLAMCRAIARNHPE